MSTDATIGYQLPLDLGPLPSSLQAFDALPGPSATPRPLLVLDVVVCHLCTGHHPVERCPARRLCALCAGPHLEASHASSITPPA